MRIEKVTGNTEKPFKVEAAPTLLNIKSLVQSTISRILWLFD